MARKSGLEPVGLRSYNNLHITFDETKRLSTLLERGLDFADAGTVLMGPHLEFEDTRRDYGETRMVCYGYLHSRLVVVGYVSRGSSVHIFSMRKANARERKKIGARLWI